MGCRGKKRFYERLSILDVQRRTNAECYQISNELSPTKTNICKLNEIATRLYTHTLAYTNTQREVRVFFIHARTQTHAWAHTHSLTNAHTHTHTCLHTHTHTQKGKSEYFLRSLGQTSESNLIQNIWDVFATKLNSQLFFSIRPWIFSTSVFWLFTATWSHVHWLKTVRMLLHICGPWGHIHQTILVG